MYKNILIPVDGSPPSEYAAAVGLTLARRLNAASVFAHVSEPRRYLELRDLEEAKTQARTLGQDLLEHWRHEARRQHVTVSLWLAERPDVAEALCEAAQAEGCDLIVLGTHGRTGLPRLLLGSVAEHVARLAPTPILLVRGDAAQQPPVFTRVLLATDGSPEGTRALEHADGLAQGLGARLTLLHVAFDVGYAPKHLGRYQQYTDPETLERQFAQSRAHLREQGQTLLAEAKGHCHSPEVETVLRESLYELTSEVICKVAEERGHDLIVMGTHGYTGLRRFLLGSVASEVAHRAKQPVLLVRDRLVSD